MANTFLTGYPILKSKFEEIVDLIQDGENITSLWMPMSSRTDFAIKLQTKDGIPSKLASRLVFVYLDLSLAQEFIERQLEETLGRFSDKTGVRNKLVDIVAKGKRVVLILDNFSLENLDWVKYILSLRHECPPKSVTFLLLAYESEFYARSTTKSDFSLIYHNIIKLPYFVPSEAREWLKTQKPRLTEKEMDLAIEFCGGIHGLLVNFLRARKRFNTSEEAIKSEQIRNSIKHLWGRFSDREQYVLKTIVNTGKAPFYAFEIDYMKDHNLLTNMNTINGDWMKQVVGVPSVVHLRITSDGIYWNGMDMSELFTDKERDIFRSLVTKNELSRDQVGEILWGKDSNQYSDWAIDQIFSRMRKKLETAGIGEDKIKTVKGKGFKTENLKLV